MTKIGMRKAWFQLHKWIGLILAILIIPLCATGAALVWDEALDHGLNPQRYATTGTQTLDPQRYVDAAKAALGPDARVSTLTLPAEDGPVIVAALPVGATPQAGPPARINVWLDPPTTRVLDKASSNAGLIRVMHQIHGTMLIPVWGRSIVGWIGVFMLFSCFTGIWLWWPTVGRWARGLRWRRHPNFDTNLHHLFGFWIAVPLFVLSLTGAWISFPTFFGPLMGARPQAGPDRAAMTRARPLGNPRLSVSTAVNRFPYGTKDVATVAWPTDKSSEWKITYRSGVVGVVDDNGRYASIADHPPKEDTARLMRRIHDGTRMGLVWQILIFLGGLLPTILAITGVIMWWRARGWKSELKRKQKARAEAV